MQHSSGNCGELGECWWCVQYVYWQRQRPWAPPDCLSECTRNCVTANYIARTSIPTCNNMLRGLSHIRAPALWTSNHSMRIGDLRPRAEPASGCKLQTHLLPRVLTYLQAGKHPAGSAGSAAPVCNSKQTSKVGAHHTTTMRLISTTLPIQSLVNRCKKINPELMLDSVLP